MAECHHFLLVVLSLIICVTAAPSDVSRLNDIVKIEKEDIDKNSQETIDVPVTLTDDVKDETRSTQGQRQKRWYNFYGYGIPPMNPVIYPNYKRDDSDYTNVYGGEDPFGQIYRRLQEIAGAVRQPVVPPPPPQFPVYFPVIFIPYVNCACNPQNTPVPPATNPNNGTTPEIENRFPEMNDPRQNWGVVVNRTDDVDEDFTRPISFEPIRPINNLSRPPPPVEHGSSQTSANSQSNTQSQTTTTTVSSLNNEENLSASFDSPDIPSVCDGVVLSCCHQSQVTYDCFATQGCPDLTSYGNPCEAEVILSVIEKFQKYYGQKTG